MIENELDFFRPKTITINLEEIKNYQNNIQFPVVIKPFIGAHSRAVQMVNNQKELNKAIKVLNRHFKSQKTELMTQGNNKILIEEYIDGKQLTPICYVDKKGRVTILSYHDIVKSRDLGQDNMQILYRTTPSKYPNYITEKIKYVLQKIVKASNLKSTFLDPEFIVKKNKVYLIEVNVRAGGFRYEAMKYAFGINIDQLSINLALGKEIIDDFQFIKNCTAAEVWEENSGVIKSITIPKSKYIKEQQLLLKENDEYLAPPIGNKAIAKYYIASENDNSLNIAKNIRKK